MTPEAQRIAIAEACGYTEIDVIYKMQPPPIGDEPAQPREVLGIMGKFPTPTVCQPWLPDYLADLNAMHEAERVLMDQDLWYDYIAHLQAAVTGEPHEWRLYREHRCTNIDAYHATAAQRAEAFLRTLNLWKEAADVR